MELVTYLDLNERFQEDRLDAISHGLQDHRTKTPEGEEGAGLHENSDRRGIVAGLEGPKDRRDFCSHGNHANRDADRDESVEGKTNSVKCK